MEGQRCWDGHMEKLGGTVGSVVRLSQLCFCLQPLSGRLR